MQAGQMQSLLVGRDARRPRIIALDVHEAPHGFDDDVGAGIGTIGATETKGRQGSPDQVWKVSGKPFEVHPACRPGRYALCAYYDIRLRGQGTKALLVLRLV